MPNLQLVAQMPMEIDHSFSVTATRGSITVPIPTTFKAGALGPIGIAQGIGAPTAQLSFAIPVTGFEFDWATLQKKPAGFTISYTLGNVKYALVGCRIQNKGVENDPAGGDATLSIGLMATEEIKL